MFVNGRTVKESELRDGDQLQIGNFKFKFADPSKRRSPKPAPAGALEVTGSVEPVRLEGKATVIGRRPTCDLSLIESSVSTVHALVFEANGKRYVRDLGSRTGTYINGIAVHQQELNFGDVLKVGETEFRYVPAEAAEALDELEDLVGTARLGSDPEIASEQAAPPVATPKAKAPQKAGPASAPARPRPRPTARRVVRPASPVAPPPIPLEPRAAPPRRRMTISS